MATILGLEVGDECFALGVVAGMQWYRARLIGVRPRFPQFHVEYLETLSGDTSTLALPQPRKNFVPQTHVRIDEPPTNERDDADAGRKRSRRARPFADDEKRDGHSAAEPVDNWASRAARRQAAARAAAARAMGDPDGPTSGPTEWLSSPKGAAASDVTSVPIGPDFQVAMPPVLAASILPPPAEPPRCYCEMPAVWERHRWWCARADDGCPFECPPPPTSQTPLCRCGVRAVWVREQWWCPRPRGVGGCGFHEVPRERKDDKLVHHAQIDVELANGTAALLSSVAYGEEEAQLERGERPPPKRTLHEMPPAAPRHLPSPNAASCRSSLGQSTFLRHISQLACASTIRTMTTRNAARAVRLAIRTRCSCAMATTASWPTTPTASSRRSTPSR